MFFSKIKMVSQNCYSLWYVGFFFSFLCLPCFYYDFVEIAQLSWFFKQGLVFVDDIGCPLCNRVGRFTRREPFSFQPVSCTCHFFQQVSAITQSGTCRRTEWNDCFSGEIICCDKPVHWPCGNPPPNRIPNKYSVIAVPKWKPVLPFFGQGCHVLRKHGCHCLSNLNHRKCRVQLAQL